MSAQEKRQEVIRKVLGADNVEATMKAALAAQGQAERGAEMQIQFILACSSSKLVRNDPMPNLFDDIIHTQREKIAHYGERTYSLSEKQIAVIAKHFARIVIKE